MSLLLETNCGWSLGLMQHQSRTMAAVWKFPLPRLPAGYTTG